MNLQKKEDETVVKFGDRSKIGAANLPEKSFPLCAISWVSSVKYEV